MSTIVFKLTDEQERTVHEFLREAYLNGAAVFAEIRRETFPQADGALLTFALVGRKAALAIQKAVKEDLKPQ